MEDLGFLEKTLPHLTPRKIRGSIVCKNYSASYNTKKVLKVKKQYKTNV